MMPEHAPKRRYTIDEACAELAIEKGQFNKYVRAGVFPQGLVRGAKLRFWTHEDLIAMFYLEENKHRFAWFKNIKDTPDEGEEGEE